MRRSVVMLSVAVLALAGCNTMVQKSYQMVKVVTPGVENVECILETGKNRYRVITPNDALVERSRRPMTVTCEKGHYYPATLEVESKIRAGHMVWNVFNGIVPGTAWDIADNSIYDYPETVEVAMELNQDSLNAALGELTEEVGPPPKKLRDIVEEPENSPSAADESFGSSLRK